MKESCDKLIEIRAYIDLLARRLKTDMAALDQALTREYVEAVADG